MTDQETPQQDESESTQSEPRQSSGSKFSVIRLLVITVACLAVFFLVLAGVFFDLPTKFREMTRPALVTGSGVVTWEGFPLTGGTLIIYPVEEGLPPSFGFIGEGGKFKFQTNIKGTYVDGAYLGEKKATVEHYGVDAPLGAPPATPPEYGKRETTPIRITVSKSPEKNKYTIDIKGKPTRGTSIPKVLGLDLDDADDDSPTDSVAPASDEPPGETGSESSDASDTQ